MKPTLSDNDVLKFLTHHLTPDEHTRIEELIRASPELQHQVEEMRQILPALLAARDEERLRMMKEWDRQLKDKKRKLLPGCTWMLSIFAGAVLISLIFFIVYRYDSHRLAIRAVKDIRLAVTERNVVPSSAWDSVMWWVENEKYPESIWLLESYKVKMGTEDRWIAEATILLLKLGQSGPTDTWEREVKDWMQDHPPAQSAMLMTAWKRHQEPWYRLLYSPIRRLCAYPVRTGIM